jgi:hypothetical protein
MSLYNRVIHLFGKVKGGRFDKSVICCLGTAYERILPQKKGCSHHVDARHYSE